MWASDDRGLRLWCIRRFVSCYIGIQTALRISKTFHVGEVIFSTRFKCIGINTSTREIYGDIIITIIITSHPCTLACWRTNVVIILHAVKQKESNICATPTSCTWCLISYWWVQYQPPCQGLGWYFLYSNKRANIMMLTTWQLQRSKFIPKNNIYERVKHNNPLGKERWRRYWHIGQRCGRRADAIPRGISIGR